MIQSVYEDSAARDVLSPAGSPRHEVPACHARAALHRCLGEGASYVTGNLYSCIPIPTCFFLEDERPCYHVPPPRPSWLRRLWQPLSKHAPTASRTVLVTQDERCSARTRYPCDIYG